jgi:hypothetical protein
MPITFGSIGDIISLCSVIQNLINALDEVSGAGAQYREIAQELHTLDLGLNEIKRLAEKHSEVLALQPIFQTAAHAAGQCQSSIESFLAKISKYGKYLREGGSGNVVKDGIFKSKWQLLESGDLVQFRAHIIAHTGSLNLLMSTINM